MWPFRRRRDTEPDAPSTAPAAAARSESAPPPAPQAWRTLPQIQRTVGPPPHTYRTDDIGEILSSWHSPQLSGEMGHQVSADAPSGVLHGMSTAVETTPAGTLRSSAETGVLREPVHAHHEAEEEAPRAVWSTPEPSTAATAAASSSDGSGANPPPSAAASPARPSASASVQRSAAPDAPGTTPSTAEAAHRPIGALRSLVAHDDPVPTVSRVVAPQVVTPRPLPALVMQRSAEPAASGATAVTVPPHAGTAAPTAEPLASPDAPRPGDAPPAEPSHITPLGASPPLIHAGDDAESGLASAPLPPGAVLEPPIQPRSLQRRAADLPLPPVGRQTAGDDPDAAAMDGAPAGALAPASAGDAGSDPAGGAAPTPTAEVEPGTTAGGHAEADPGTAPLTGGQPPLVQRTEEGHFPGDGHDHGEAEAEGGEGPSMPLQRQITGAPADDAPSPAPTIRPVGLGAPLSSTTDVPVGAQSGPAAAPSIESSPGQGQAAAGAAMPLSRPAVQRQTDSSTAGSATTSAGAPPAPSTPSSVAPASEGQTPTATPTDVGADAGGAGVAAAAQTAGLVGDTPLTTAEPTALVDTGPATEAGATRGEGASGFAAPGPLTLSPPAPVPAASPVTVSTLRDTPLVLQRAVDDGPPTVLGPAPEHSPAPTPVTARPIAAAVPPGTLRASTAGAPSVQRTLSPASSPGRQPSTVLTSAPTGPANPAMTLASPPRPEVVSPSWPDPGQLAVDNGIAQRMPDGSVQFTVQREETGSVRDRINQFESMSGGGGAAPATTSGGPTITATATDTPPPAGTGGNEREQLEEQAKKLWPHIKRKLTNELQSGPTGRQARW